MRTTKVAAAAIAGSSLALGVGAARILAVVEKSDAEYTRLFGSLEARNHTVAVRSPSDAEPSLFQHDSRAFDHVLLFAPSAKAFGGDFNPQRLYEFLEEGGNAFVGVSPSVSEFWRDFAREFDLDFDDRGSSVFDFFSSISEVGISIPPAPLSENVVISRAVRSGPSILYNGIGHRRGANPLIVPVLDAPETAISSEAGRAQEAEAFVAGADIGLVSAFQTRKNARIVFCGSTALLSDAALKGKNGNAAFVEDLTKWVFQERSVLRVLSSEHQKVGGLANPKQYRVKDEIEYRLQIQAYDDGKWGPLPLEDVQLDFTMLDPHVRIPLSPSASQPSPASTELSTTFIAPDRHGVFTFKIDYRRPGWTFLRDDKRVAVTPPRHDEYPRFIGGALPYYLGTVSTVLAFGAFSVVWILHTPSTGGKR